MLEALTYDMKWYGAWYVFSLCKVFKGWCTLAGTHCGYSLTGVHWQLHSGRRHTVVTVVSGRPLHATTEGTQGCKGARRRISWTRLRHPSVKAGVRAFLTGQKVLLNHVRYRETVTEVCSNHSEYLQSTPPWPMLFDKITDWGGHLRYVTTTDICRILWSPNICNTVYV